MTEFSDESLVLIDLIINLEAIKVTIPLSTPTSVKTNLGEALYTLKAELGQKLMEDSLRNARERLQTDCF